MLWPPKYNRKFRCRSDRQARDIPGLLIETEGVGEISALTGFYFATSAQMPKFPTCREMAFLPKPVRDALQIRPGDSLELESSEDHIILRPAKGRAHMYKKQGVWVLQGDAPLPGSAVEDTIRNVRRERERAILGKHQ